MTFLRYKIHHFYYIMNNVTKKLNRKTVVKKCLQYCVNKKYIYLKILNTAFNLLKIAFRMQHNNRIRN